MTKGWECQGECGMIQRLDDDDPGPETCENCNGPVSAVTITPGWNS